MKAITSLIGLVLILVLLPVEASEGSFHFAQADETTDAPLLLFIEGNGRVVPFKNGQLLPVGHEFEMTAAASRGYEFAYWTLVSVFTDSEVLYDAYDVPIATNSVVTIAPSHQQIQRCSIEFTVKPAQVLIDIPGVRTLTRSVGWQATFVNSRKGSG